MTEVWFFHLERRPFAQVLPQLLEKTLQRGWRAVVKTAQPGRVEDIVTLLWSSTEDSFLPHGSARDGFGERQPVWITSGDDRPNGAEVVFLIDGAEAPPLEGISRAVHLFEGADPAATDRARQDWKAAKLAGHTVSYWQQDERGQWVNRA